MMRLRLSVLFTGILCLSVFAIAVWIPAHFLMKEGGSGIILDEISESSQPNTTAPPEHEVRELRELLKSADEGSRLVALSRLCQFNPKIPGVVESLRCALQDPVEDIVLTAAYAAGQQGQECRELSPELRTLCQHRSSRVRRSALDALASVAQGDALTRQTVRAALEDSNAGVRSTAIRCLREWGPLEREDTAAFVRLVADSDPWVREGSAEHLLSSTSLRSEELGAALKLLTDSDLSVRRGVAYALCERKHPPAPVASSITAALQIEQDSSTLIAMLQALDQYGEDGAEGVPIVYKLAKHNDSDVRCIATQTLGRIGADHKLTANILLEQTHDPDKLVQLLALGAVARLKKPTPQLLSRLQQMTRHPDLDYRTSAESSLRIEVDPIV